LICFASQTEMRASDQRPGRSARGRLAWFIGALIVMVYVIFGMTLNLLPPRT